MDSKPKYLARPSDGTVFSLNSDGLTYSVFKLKMSRTDSLHNKYSYDVLLSYSFYPVIESDFDSLKEKENEYYDFLSWENRSDGHGGVKGGTIKEFRKLKKQKK